MKVFKKVDNPYFWIELTSLKAAEPVQVDSLFIHQVPKTFWYLFDHLNKING